MDEKNNAATVNSGPAKPYQRHIRNILIHKPLQREFLFVTIALLMISTFAIGFVIHSTIRDAAFGGGFHFGKISPYDILSEVSYSLVTRVSFILFATLLVLAVFGISFLHRVAGPVYRFRQVLLRINRGEIPGNIQLREGDYFTETADEINKVLKKLQFEKNQLETAKQTLEKILAANPGENIANSVRGLQATLNSKPE